MIMPCRDCITLPMCINKYLKHYRRLEPIYVENYTINIHAIVEMRSHCQILKDYLYGDDEPFENSVQHVIFFYDRRTQNK